MKITMADLRAAGLSEAQILQVIEAADNRETEKRHAQLREASRVYRAKRHQNHDDHVDRDDRVYPSSLLPSATTLEKEVRSEIVAPAREFVTFWQQYPHKVGKRAAATAFERARRRAAFDIITAGLARYAAKTDDRPWCNPATWLNQDRWEDQPGPAQEGNGKAKDADPASSRWLTYAAEWEERSKQQLANRERVEQKFRQ